MHEVDIQRAKEIALQFTHSLIQNDYLKAYALTTLTYQQRVSLQQVQEYFENIIPEDWGPMENVEIVGDMQIDWADKQPSDIGWVYISLEGMIYPYSEGLYIQVSRTEHEMLVNEVWFGRP